MNPELLFGIALGITPSFWEVEGIEFSKENKRLDIKIEASAALLFPCPVCGSPAPHDTTEKTWRHLEFLQYEAARPPVCHGLNVPTLTAGSSRLPFLGARGRFRLYAAFRGSGHGLGS